MKAKSELLLYLISWRLDQMLRPTPGNLAASFEGWAYRNGLLKQIHRLEAKGFLEKHPEPGNPEPFYRLTAAGRAVALGGRDPHIAWERKWDGCWRLFLFDIPAKEQKLRRDLLSALRSAGCGCLQGSVWIACDLPKELEPFLKNSDANPASLLVLETKPRSLEVARRMVEAAWNFEEIDRSHMKLMNNLNRYSADMTAEALLAWAQRDLEAWKNIVAIDPFLPRTLLPDGYAGEDILATRREVLHKAALHIQRFETDAPETPVDNKMIT